MKNLALAIHFDGGSRINTLADLYATKYLVKHI